MFIPFFLELKAAKVPVTLREFLTLMEGMNVHIADYDVESFYFLARAALVKDERFIDRFDQVFAHYFKGVEAVSGEGAIDARDLPEEWLRRLADRHLSEEEKRLVESLGGFDKLMETLKQRLEEQKGRHQGGSKWIRRGGIGAGILCTGIARFVGAMFAQLEFEQIGRASCRERV